MTLRDLGWSPFFAHSFESLPFSSLIPARVVRQDRTRVLLHDAARSFPGVLAGSYEPPPGVGPGLPAVGDWVAAEPCDPARIRAVLPRQSVFSRKAAGEATREQVVAANLDALFLVSGLDGELNLRRIERYVTQARSGGALPVILLNKCDRSPDPDAARRAAERAAPGVAVLLVSAHTGEGMEGLAPYLASGRTVAFLGSSGVGKSSLLNRLLGVEAAATGAVREQDGRGRHTTTRRELFFAPGGGMIVDTPGLRELGLWGEPGDVGGEFEEIERLAAGCRFRDCRHEGEPGCAVRAAMDDGLLDPARLRSYAKLARELEFLERRRDEHYAREERRRGREGARLIEEAKRRKGR